MRSARWCLPLVLLAPTLLAGCGTPDEEEANQPTTVGPGPTGNAPAPAAFVVEGPTLTPLDGINRSLREDDGALVRYKLGLPADASGPATALVSFILNGNVTDVETVRLDPGQSKSYEQKMPEVRGMKAVSVEVRAGSASGKATAPVSAWPRQGETLAFDPYFTVRVDNWTRDEVQGATLVGVSFERGAQTFREFRAHLLCADEKGAVKSEGTSRPELQPNPMGAEAFTLRLPLCPATGSTYGVDFKADVEDGNVYGRVLFVPHGWAPPAAPTPS